MKKSIIILLALTSIMSLVACSKVVMSDATESLLQNPLYAEQYWEDLVQQMVNQQMSPNAAKDPAAKIVDAVRVDALAKAQAATTLRGQGMKGDFVGVTVQTQGTALLLKNALYFGPGFLSFPGPSLHVFLTGIVDPRDAAFPDPTGIDLGLIQTPYGAQQYAIPTSANLAILRTAVLYDTQLKKVYGFAQLAK